MTSLCPTEAASCRKWGDMEHLFLYRFTFPDPHKGSATHLRARTSRSCLPWRVLCKESVFADGPWLFSWGFHQGSMRSWALKCSERGSFGAPMALKNSFIDSKALRLQAPALSVEADDSLRGQASTCLQWLRPSLQNG